MVNLQTSRRWHSLAHYNVFELINFAPTTTIIIVTIITTTVTMQIVTQTIMSMITNNWSEF